MLHTTFAKAREAGACPSSYRKFAEFKGGVKAWGENNPFPLSEVLEVCGLDDALWCLRIVIEPADREVRLLACDYAERVLSIWEKRFPDDKRPRQAIETSRRFAEGKATRDELVKAEAAAVEAAVEATAWAWTARAAAWAVVETAAWAMEAWAAQQWQTQRRIELLQIQCCY